MPDEAKFRARRIADPVHGTVWLSDLEIEVLSTQAFQRLRGVKQLGLAHLVFPGADYSRLSHSIGVNHVTGRILDSLRNNSGLEITDADYELYRLAGLLHDIGHYPFSHTLENAISEHYRDESQPMLFTSTLQPTGNQEALIPYDENASEAKSLKHEAVGGLLLETDEEIKGVLAKYDIDPKSIHGVFTRRLSESGAAPNLANLISSDLDADRIDYLSRTAMHTGLPYGIVDIDYLLSQMRLDNDNRICLDPSALRTAEHFLLGRYFDYQQVSFHKTVAALEWVLGDVVKELLRLGKFDCSRLGIENMVTKGEWQDFDDSYVMRLAKDLDDESISEHVRSKVRALTQRIPPKLIGSFEFFGDRENEEAHNFRTNFLTGLCAELSTEFGIHRDLWYVWGNKKMSLTKTGPRVPASMVPIDSDDADAAAQVVRIKEGEESKPISEVPRSLLSVLAQRALFSARLYVVLSPNQEGLRKAIAERVEGKIAAAGVSTNWVREQ